MTVKQARGLGRGFDSLLPQNFDASVLVDERERVQKLAISDISPNLQQPRKHFDEQALDELASSIKHHGLLQPIVVTPTGEGKYEIIAGERRWRAATKAGLDTISALVRSSQELEKLEIALVENVQRVDLSPLEQAVSIARLHDQFNLPYEEVAKRIGKALSTVINIARLLQLPPQAQKALQEKQITEGHARAIISFKDKTKQLELLNLIIKNKWTVRQAEQYVTAHKEGLLDSKKATERIRATTPETTQLGKLLKTKVTLKRTAKGGKIEIAFTSEENLQNLIKRLLQK
jgi:ParB family chromosome partitioning protein